MELDLIRMTVSQALATVREALANYTSSETIEIRTDNEVVKLNLYNQLHKMGMRCKLERKGSYFLLKATPKGMSSERQAIRRASREPEEAFAEQQIVDPPAPQDKGVAMPRKEALAFPVREENLMPKRPSAPPKAAPKPAATYESAAAKQRQATVQAAAPTPPRRAEMPAPPTLFNGEYDETPIQPGQGPWLVFQHDQIGQKDNNLGVDLLHQMLESLAPGAYAGLFLVHRGVRLVDPQYHQAKLLRALLRKPIAVFADETSMQYFNLIGKTSPRVKVVPFAALLEVGRTQPVIWF